MSSHDDFSLGGAKLGDNRGNWVSAVGSEHLMGSVPPPNAAHFDARDLDEIAGRHFADGWRAGQADLQEQIRDALHTARYEGETAGRTYGVAEERNWWQSNVAHDVWELRTRLQDLPSPGRKRSEALVTLLELAESLCLKEVGRRD